MVNMYKHMCRYVHIFVIICMYVCLCVRVYIYIYIYIYICTYKGKSVTLKARGAKRVPGS